MAGNGGLDGVELDAAVRSVVGDCLGVKEGEDVLVICNAATEPIGEAMWTEARRFGSDSTLALMHERASHAGEPPAPIAAAMAAADVVLAPTVQSLSHTAARKAASEAGARIATLPGVTPTMLARVMSADMEGLRRRGGEVAELLTKGREARITCSRGSDLTLGLEGRAAIPDAGRLTHRSAFGNLPCGEGFIAPIEGTGKGRLVIDGSMAGIGLVIEPVTLEVADGHLISASGPQGAQFLELLTVHGPDGTNVAELGIGTNEKALLTGDILEDEKILGTAHVAFGASAAIGGTVQVPIHLDCVILQPTVTVDGAELIRAGKLLIE